MPPKPCLAYKLTIRSDLEIPGAIPLDIPGAIDAEIREGAIEIGERVTAGPYIVFDDRLCFEAPGVARYLCTARSITIERVAGASDAQVAGFLVATALPALLWMRGEIVLHAAAAMLPGARGAVAILGPSGSGKSSVLRQLIDAGARIVADDTIRVAAGEVSGLPGGYFFGSAPRIFHPVPREAVVTAAPLAGLVLLETPRSAGPPAFRRLAQLQAFETLLNNRHRPRIPLLLGLQPKLVAPLSELARTVPVHAWKRRDGAEMLDAQELAFLSSL